MQNRLWQQNADNPSGGQYTNEGFHSQRDRSYARGSLGQFIERSTSAPPLSSSSLLFGGGSSEDKFNHPDHSLVGNDLLECVTSGYSDLNIGSRSNNQRKGNKIVENNSSCESEEDFGVVWLDLGDNNDAESNDFLRASSTSASGLMSSTVGSMGSSLSRPLSASGDAFTGIESRRSLLYGDLPLSLASGMIRSQSAAPSSSSRNSLGPPPGLADLADDSYSSSSSSRQQHTASQWGHGIRRPASAGVLIGGGRVSSPSAGSATLRPAAKTLMDLIQEDVSPEEPVNAANVGTMIMNNNLRMPSKTAHSFGVEASLDGSASPSPAVRSRQNSNVTINIREPAREASQSVGSFGASPSQYQPQQFSVPQQQQAIDDNGSGTYRNYQNSNLQQQNGLQQVNQHAHISQAQLNQQARVGPSIIHQPIMTQPNSNQLSIIGHFDGNGAMEQQFTSIGHPQIGARDGTIIRQGIPTDDPMHNSIYPQVQQQQQQSNHLQHPQQQQIFYNGQRLDLTQSIQSQGMQSQGIQHNIHPPSIHGIPVQSMQPTQTIQLPNGQTVFVNTSPPPQPQSYGYASVQYHTSSNQHPHLIQQTMHSGLNDGQYVSVVSVPSGQQMTYWHPSGVSNQQGSIGMTNGNGVTGPVTITRVHAPSDITPQQQLHSNQFSANALRAREKGGGRGRRGATTGRRGTDSKASAASMTSPLLEEFRASKSRDWTMRRIEGHVVEFCQDQNGSRFIQQRLEMGDVTEQQIVMNEVLPAIRRLRNDVFGNYVVQKLLDFGTPKMKVDIQSTLEGEMVQLSLQMYGCRVVQKALEAINEDDLPRLLQEFHHNVLSCIHDQNGNHVIQKCIEVLNSRSNKAKQVGDIHRAAFLAEQIDFVINDVLVNTTTLSCHPYGCRVLQRILEHCSDEKKTAILDEIKKCHEKLLDDQYGNYVIQHVLQFGREEDRDSILEIVVKNGLLILSRQKFASNVVEKLLKYGNSSQRCAVVREMLKRTDELSTPSEPTDGSSTVVLLMVRDAYANYVVQTTLDVVPESEEKQKLLEELNSHAEELRNYTFAKHIVAKLSSLNGSDS